MAGWCVPGTADGAGAGAGAEATEDRREQLAAPLCLSPLLHRPACGESSPGQQQTAFSDSTCTYTLERVEEREREKMGGGG